MPLLADRHILLGVSGSIAAYKAADWIRALRRGGCRVTVVMTEAACRFISPLTMAALSGNPVHTAMFGEGTPESIPHISLARQSDLNLIAPATAQTIARLAHGLADDLLATIVLASSAPTLICPAMNSKMYLHPATQANLAALRSYGYRIIEGDCGEMACGEEGPGRLAEWEAARAAIRSALSPQDLAGKRVLITAGPTREALDPARFISNRSSGRMGYALAAVARERGATVTLISGPSSLPAPIGVERIMVTTALEMQREVLDRHLGAAVIVKAAAVADYRPAESLAHKQKKGTPELQLNLVTNPDILRELGERKKGKDCFPLLVGFAAESRDHLAEAARKLRDKGLDLIVVNDIGGSETGFEAATNQVSILDDQGSREDLPLLSKEETAQRIWNRIVRRLKEQSR